MANGVPEYSHIVVVMEENKNYNEIIGNTSQAPYINSLAAGGALLTNYSAITHPSQPNYFALYAGSTFGTTDDNIYSEPDPTLATVLQSAGLTFQGYVDQSDSDINHNPWESFPEGWSDQTDFGPTTSYATFNSMFPSGNFSSLPTVSFVIPGIYNDMHSGTIQQGDSWLQTNLGAYAQWAKANNSLLVIDWDESDDSGAPEQPNPNQVPAILYGADVVPGDYSTAYNHYNMLATLLAAYGLTGPNNAATAAPINVFSTTVSSGTLAGSVLLSKATEGTAIPAGTTIASFTDSNTADAASGFTATINWGDGTSSAGTISGGNGTFTVNGGHTYANYGSDVLSVGVTRTANGATITPSGTVTVADANVLTGHATTLAATAGQALSNVTVASFTDAYAASVAGDFTAAINWGDGTSSAGTISGGNGTFSVAGSHTYANAGTDTVAVTLSDTPPGTATATADSTAQVGGGSSSSGTIIVNGPTTGSINLTSTDNALQITSTGTITSSSDGVNGPATAPAIVTNSGTISAAGSYGDGIGLPDGGTVTNNAGGSIAATYAVEATGGSTTVINGGTLNGGHHAVLFTSGATGTNRVVVEPSAVFQGNLEADVGTNTLELAGGTGSLNGMSGTSGTVTENGSWAFTGFQTISVDAGGSWTLNGGTADTLVNNGTIAVTGSADISSGIGSASTGLFQLTSGSTLEVAAALGTQTQMAFLGTSKLVIDAVGSFGISVGTSSYAGPQLQDFGAGDTIDLKGFGSTGAAVQFNSTNGILQITNGAGQKASLNFQVASLGTGSFHAATDGSSGTFLTRA